MSFLWHTRAKDEAEFFICNMKMQWLRRTENVAIVSGERRISFSQLVDCANFGGGQLPPGGRVAIVGANSPEWAMALYSVWHAKKVAVPVDFMSTPDEMAFIFDDCTPVAVWCDEASRSKVEEAFSKMKSQTPVLLSFGIFNNVPNCEGEEFGENELENIALIIYTSGTTGAPKGVQLTFGNCYASIRSCQKDIPIFKDDECLLVVLPLHHTYPLETTLMLPLLLNCPAVFVTEISAEAILGALKVNHCTVIAAVPRMLELFRNSIMRKINGSFAARMLFRICAKCHSLRLSRLVFRRVQNAFGGRLRNITCGGAAADRQVIKDMYTLGFSILEGYGMTETAPLISVTPPGHYVQGAVGKPIPCCQVRIVDGEVQVRGENITSGYYNRPEETAAAIDADGWLKTGDLGYIDENGFLFITGRRKELIILGNGKNINPDDIEKQIMRYSNGLVAECALSEKDNVLTMLVVPNMKAVKERDIVNIRQTLQATFIDKYNQGTPSYRRVDKFILWQQPLPRTRLGKLKRFEIKNLLKNGEEPRKVSNDPPPDTKAYRKIAQYLEETVGHSIAPDEHFELDISLDSLGKLGFLSFLNDEFGAWVPVSYLAEYPTARLLSEAIANHRGDEEIGALHEVNLNSLSKCRRLCLIRDSAAFLIRRFAKLETFGYDKVPNEPCIFVPNHQSFLDAFCMCAEFDNRRMENTYFYATAKYVGGNFIGKVSRSLNIVAMNINGDLRQSLEFLVTALKNGKSLVIFPEGTRTMDGNVGEYKQAFAILAKKSGAKVVPVVIDGAYDVLSRHRRFPAFGKSIKVSFLSPLEFSQEATLAEIAELARDKVVSALKGDKK